MEAARHGLAWRYSQSAAEGFALIGRLLVGAAPGEMRAKIACGLRREARLDVYLLTVSGAGNALAEPLAEGGIGTERRHGRAHRIDPRTLPSAAEPARPTDLARDTQPAPGMPRCTDTLPVSAFSSSVYITDLLPRCGGTFQTDWKEQDARICFLIVLGG